MLMQFMANFYTQKDDRTLLSPLLSELNVKWQDTIVICLGLSTLEFERI